MQDMVRQAAETCRRGCNIDGLRWDAELEGMVDCSCRNVVLRKQLMEPMTVNQPMKYEESSLSHKLWGKGRWLFEGNKQQWKRHVWPLLLEVIKQEGTYRVISCDRLVFAEFGEDGEIDKPLMDLLDPTILIIELRAGALFKERGPLRLKNIVEERDNMGKPTWVWYGDDVSHIAKEFGANFAAFMDNGWNIEVFR